MKSNKALFLVFLLLVIVAAVYRAIPGRPMGFAPHLAMALFAGAVIKDKKWAFAFPIFSLFLSDLLYQVLYLNGLSTIRGFYEGQLTNYLLIAVITGIGMLMRKITIINVILYSVLVCISFFLLSNFFVWINGAGLERPKNFAGLMQCYADAVPFLRYSFESTIIFSALLFGAWRLIRSKSPSPAIA